ncbi:ASCH/PUA domain-containing protein [Burkholderia gladioli]|uniref:ASCH/PUA domain-containing protein n=1 Tax=Burkholderia gladioli TaxID=28095 RepID=UPI001ABB8269|nr:ASCH/PUA domain-containing protein [Burkholderia gladioli]
MNHELKTDPDVFAAVLTGRKTHEIRFNDRSFKVGDMLLLRETKYSGESMKAAPDDYPLEYTGREAERVVSHVLDGDGYGLQPGWVVLSFAPARHPSALRAAVPAPAGWRLVPEVVTESMLDAWFRTQGGNADRFVRRWTAMLDAAPAIPVAASAPHEWAPDRIYLQREQGEGGAHTWCEDSVGDGELIEEAAYIRVDAAPAAPVDAVDEFAQQALLDRDLAMFGVSCKVDGKRIEPERVSILSAKAVAADGAPLDEDRIDWIANAHCPGGTAYPVNVKNAIREALCEARAAVSPATAEPCTPFRMSVSKEWCMEMARQEPADGQIGAGVREPATADERVAPMSSDVRAYLENLAKAGSEPLNSAVAYKDKASRMHFMVEVRNGARALLARASQAVAREHDDPEIIAASNRGYAAGLRDGKALGACGPLAADAGKPFQSRVQPWMLECFGPTIAADTIERNHRFLEEALELVQSLGCTASEAHQLVDYTFGRPIGEPMQEVGGVMVTLAALCLASELDMHQAGETELARISEPAIVLKIRAKQAAKPKHSPLPQAVAARSPYEWRDTGPLETGEGDAP